MCRENIARKTMNRTNSGCKEITSNRYDQKLVVADTSNKDQRMDSQRNLDRKARTILSLITWSRFQPNHRGGVQKINCQIAAKRKKVRV